MKPAQVLGISGSPRRNGNSELLIREFIRGAESGGHKAELIILSELKISPCTSCGSCQKNGKCIIIDDMQLMHEKLLQADCIVFASPIYFGGVSAQLKSFIDRCQTLWSRKYILKQELISPDRGKRAGYFISTAGTKGYSRVFEGAILTVKAIFSSLDIEYTGELLFEDIENKGDILNHPDAMKMAFETGSSIALEKN